MTVVIKISSLCLLLTAFLLVQTVYADHTSDIEHRSDAELASELNNPLADLMIFPIQVNYDKDIGPEDDGRKLQTNVQPVIPFHLSDYWNMISRTVVPVTHQEDIYPGARSQFGLGDTLFSLFFSPRELTPEGILWGGGPALLFPTATDSKLGREQWVRGRQASS